MNIKCRRLISKVMVMLELSSHLELKSHGTPVVALPYRHHSAESGDFLFYEPPEKKLIIGYLPNGKNSNSGSRQNVEEAE